MRSAGLRTGVHAINVPDSPRASARGERQIEDLCISGFNNSAGTETVLLYISPRPAMCFFAYKAGIC